jgi:hypothetical protein
MSTTPNETSKGPYQQRAFTTNEAESEWVVRVVVFDAAGSRRAEALTNGIPTCWPVKGQRSTTPRIARQSAGPTLRASKDR